MDIFIAPTIEKPEILCDFDLVKLKSGEVLSVVGNYKGSTFRGRLTYYPNPEGTLYIDGLRYSKIRTEIDYSLPYSKVLNLPGEQHYIIVWDDVSKIYYPRNGFDHLSPHDLALYREFCQLLINHCNLRMQDFGLAGSSAINARRGSSDFDLVIYTREVGEVKNYVVDNKDFIPELTFDLNLVSEKYSVFNNFSTQELHKLFLRRWKYINYKGLHISISFVDPNSLADQFLSLENIGTEELVKGKVVDEHGSSFSPRIITVEDTKTGRYFDILSWLFLYNGAFQQGDVIESRGQNSRVDKQEFILVESPDTYIKVQEQ